MVKILFICHWKYLPQSDGGVRDEELGEKQGWHRQFQIESAATSREEIGNPVYPPGHGASWQSTGSIAKRSCSAAADEPRLRRIRSADRHGQCQTADMYCICGGDYAGKMSS